MDAVGDIKSLWIGDIQPDWTEDMLTPIFASSCTYPACGQRWTGTVCACTLLSQKCAIFLGSGGNPPPLTFPWAVRLGVRFPCPHRFPLL